jgi:hypothetical protein
MLFASFGNFGSSSTANPFNGANQGEGTFSPTLSGATITLPSSISSGYFFVYYDGGQVQTSCTVSLSSVANCVNGGGSLEFPTPGCPNPQSNPGELIAAAASFVVTGSSPSCQLNLSDSGGTFVGEGVTLFIVWSSTKLFINN